MFSTNVETRLIEILGEGAAVDPDESLALYFVATGLGDGSHTFSATLEEHTRAVSAYLQRLRTRDSQ